MASLTIESRLQAVLPEGIRLKDPVPETDDSVDSAHTGLFDVEDTRIDPPLKRLVRYIDLEGAEWESSLRERLRQLMLRPWPHVVRPIEAGFGEGGCLAWIVTDRHDAPLTKKDLLFGEGQSEDEVRKVLGQIVAGLTALHETGMAHGHLHPANVVVNASAGREPMVWLAGVETGPLAWWSGGRLLPTETNLYMPPEWKGHINQPSPAADLYAAGLIASHLLLGRSGAPSKIPAQELATDVRPWFRRQLKQGKSSVSRRMQKLIERLLDPDPQKRPDNARQVAAALQRAARRPRWILAAVILAGAVALLCGVLYVGNRRITQLEKDVTVTNQKATAMAGDLETIKTSSTSQARQTHDDHGRANADLAEANTNIKAALDNTKNILDKLGVSVTKPTTPQSTKLTSSQTRRPALPTPRPDDEIIKKTWTQAFEWKEVRKGNLRALVDAGKKISDTQTKKKYFACAKHLHDGWEKAAPWLPLDADLKWDNSLYFDETLCDLLEAAGLQPATPADGNKDWEKFQTRLGLLDEAAKDWTAWAKNRNTMTWQELQSEIAAKPDREREIVGKWVRDISQFAPTLRLVYGTAPAGSGTKLRVVAINKQENEKHDWSDAEEYDYTQDDDNIREIAFSWEPGGPIKLTLFGERGITTGYARATLMSVPVCGPLALWWMADDGFDSSGESSLSYEIRGSLPSKANTTCPGPPTRKRRSKLDRLLKNSHGAFVKDLNSLLQALGL